MLTVASPSHYKVPKMFLGGVGFGAYEHRPVLRSRMFELGLDRAGFVPVMGLDTSRDAMATYRGMFPNAETVERSVVDYDFKQWRGVDLVAGGPPCQPFSNGGKLLAAKDDRDMIPQFARAVNEIMPRASSWKTWQGCLLLGIGNTWRSFCRCSRNDTQFYRHV
jgi:hypothetical protein